MLFANYLGQTKLNPRSNNKLPHIELGELLFACMVVWICLPCLAALHVLCLTVYYVSNDAIIIMLTLAFYQ